jgi:hypothetical protein
MAVKCSCQIQQQHGTVCPSHGFAEKLEQAARDLVVAVDRGTAVKISMQKIQAVFEEMNAARHAWNRP